jgi:hypothetical protein
VVGGPERAREGLESFGAGTGADELMVTGQIIEHGARLRSFEIAAQPSGPEIEGVLQGEGRITLR